MNKRIEITGAIGSGKTSLAAQLLENGYEVVFEEFKLNPFWKAFYSNPVKYNFETEITFILQHYHELKRKLEGATNVVCDFSFTQDLGYAVMGLSKEQLRIFRAVYEYIIEELGQPKLIVYLKCSPKALLRRIRARGRPEEDLIDEGFLATLSKFIEQEINKKKSEEANVGFLEIDTEKIDFIRNPADQAFVIKTLAEFFSV
jgi:deoxyadenosine/deoxycytidine kinase